MKKSVVWIVLLILLFTTSNFRVFATHDQAIPANSNQMQQSDIGAQIDDYLTRLTAFGLSGSFLVAQDGEIVLQKGYGLANRQTGEANGPETMYGIGSLTKQFTAAAILLLETQGLLSTEDAISRYVENVPSDKAAITVSQLLKHRSGLPPYHDVSGDFEPLTREAALSRILNAPLLFAPGTGESYSNSGYTLLAMIVETLSGASYEDFIHQNFLEPLGLNRTGFPGETFEGMAYTANTYDDYGSPQDWSYSWALVGNGGMVQSVGDQYRWLSALMSGEVLPVEALDKTNADFSQPLIMAGGGEASEYFATSGYLPETNTILVGLTNQREIRAGIVVQRMIALLRGETIPMPPSAIAVAPDVLERYVGTYQLESGGVLTVSAEPDRLWIAADGQDAINAVLPARPETLQRFEAFNEQSATGLTQIQQGDFAAAAATFGDMFFSEADIRGLYQRLEGRYGTLQSFEVLGTGLSDTPDVYFTVIRLNWENASTYLKYGWDIEQGTLGEELILPEGQSASPASVPFVAQSESTFAGFNIWLANNASVEFMLNEAGEVTGLTIVSANGESVATKVMES